MGWAWVLGAAAGGPLQELLAAMCFFGPGKQRAEAAVRLQAGPFPRLVLVCINADFRVQIRIFQHFSKSTRKSSSREQILQLSAKKFEKNATMF